jgi:hypothetical protein
MSLAGLSRTPMATLDEGKDAIIQTCRMYPSQARSRLEPIICTRLGTAHIQEKSLFPSDTTAIPMIFP